MKKIAFIFCLVTIVFAACDDNDINKFDKSADERSADAIASLKNDLVSAPNGWIVRYSPVDGTGAYYLLLKFNADNTVQIRSDLGANEGEFQNQTITYRIDSSLGLELIFETYSFFSYLFELDQASFGAEYEFDFVNKTTDGLLVFSSKTDPSNPTVMTLEPASGNSANLLGQQVGLNLDVITSDLDRFSSSLKITYGSKDLQLFASLDAVKRVILFNVAAKKSNNAAKQNLNAERTYYLEGNSLVLESPVTTTVTGSQERIERITFNTLSETSIALCTDPFTVHVYSGTIAGSDIVMETTIADLAGATFATASQFYFCPLSNIRREGLPLVDEITTDVAGALEMHLYYGLELANGGTLYGIGFVIRNNDGSVTFALREFTPVLNGNNITFNFKPGYTLFGEEQTDAVVENTTKYLDALTDGNNTFVYKYAEDIFEFNNPCTGWSFVFINGN